MHTRAYDPGNEHDWAEWLTEYTTAGDIMKETVTLDAKNADGSAIVVMRATGGVVAGGLGDDVLRSAAAGSTLIGDRGNDTLIGSGGADVLYGGSGDDLYVIGAGDSVIEFADQGADVIEATISYALAAGHSIEELRLAASTGIAALNLTGNELDNTLVGNDGANVLDGGNGGADTINGGEGNDTVSYASSSRRVTIDLAGNLTWDQAKNDTLVSIENAIGSAFNDTLLGDAGDNILDGGDGGADTINGGAGNDTVNYAFSKTKVTIALNDSRTWDGVTNDTLTSIENAVGSAFNDILVGDANANVLDGGAGADAINGGEGNDTVSFASSKTKVTIALNDSRTWDGATNDTLTSIENAIGSAFNDTLVGDANLNILDGGAGSDTLKGGLGNDIYVVDAYGDVVTENADEGTDGVRTTLTSYTLGAELENLRYTGGAAFAGTGNALANTITGAGGGDILDGGAGNDTLNGAGGKDRMTGGVGNDVYVVDSTDDVVTEAAGEGTDELQTSLDSYKLGANVEILRYIGGGDFIADGNALDNTLYGRGGDDTLNGGTGNDVLRGGTGNDTYRVDNANDQVFETAGQGTDTILSDNSFALAAGQEIEFLRLTSPTGTTARNLAGNEFANTLTGNAGQNSLSGGGGNDVIEAGAGADTLNGGDGVDAVSFASTTTRYVSINLDAGVTWDGDAEDTLVSIENAVGSRFDDTLKGSTGNNVLNGGAGNDTLIGYGGSDTFSFKVILGATNVDHITDFASGDDRIMLDDGFMPGLTKGVLTSSAFKNTSQAAVDADDRILYKQSTGELFYDADGSGSGTAVRFAILDNKAALNYQDILVV